MWMNRALGVCPKWIDAFWTDIYNVRECPASGIPPVIYGAASGIPVNDDDDGDDGDDGGGGVVVNNDHNEDDDGGGTVDDDDVVAD